MLSIEGMINIQLAWGVGFLGLVGPLSASFVLCANARLIFWREKLAQAISTTFSFKVGHLVIWVLEVILEQRRNCVCVREIRQPSVRYCMVGVQNFTKNAVV